jgi:hypothetical protein
MIYLSKNNEDIKKDIFNNLTQILEFSDYIYTSDKSDLLNFIFEILDDSETLQDDILVKKFTANQLLSSGRTDGVLYIDKILSYIETNYNFLFYYKKLIGLNKIRYREKELKEKVSTHLAKVENDFRINKNSNNYRGKIYLLIKNLTELVENQIKEWEKYAPDKSKIYYKEILNYISGNSNYSGISDIINKKKQEWGPTTKEDLERVGRSAPFTNTHMFNKMDEIKESYSKTGKFEIMANLKKNREDNVDMHEFNEFDQKYTTQKQTFYAVEKEIEKYFEKLLIHNSFQESDVNQLNNLVGVLKNSINGINFEEVEIKQRIGQYKSFYDEIKRSVKDKNALNSFLNICNKILKCYQKRNIYSDC